MQKMIPMRVNPAHRCFCTMEKLFFFSTIFMPISPSPFDTLTQRIREEFREIITREIRKYRSIQKEKGCDLSWEEARKEWIAGHRKGLGEFLINGSR
jgi:hypothetical protein